MLLRRALLLLGVARAGKVCTGGQHYEQAAAAQCAVIEGDLLIQNTNLTNVLLSHLQSVEGRLYITGNSALENLGFASLTHIGGSLYVSGNGALKNLDGLRSLESVRARRPSRRPEGHCDRVGEHELRRDRKCRRHGLRGLLRVALGQAPPALRLREGGRGQRDVVLSATRDTMPKRHGVLQRLLHFWGVLRVAFLNCNANGKIGLELMVKLAGRGMAA